MTGDEGGACGNSCQSNMHMTLDAVYRPGATNTSHSGGRVLREVYEV